MKGGNIKQMQKMSKKENVKQLLELAVPKAICFLSEMLENEDISTKERIDIAKEILNRCYGKLALLEELTQNDNELKIILSKEIEDISK